MSSIKPARRWQPAFYPFKRPGFLRRCLGKIELFIKGPLFGCRMCGNCLLRETAYICPMECPKGMRNGPCGGISPEKNCYVDETRKCVWYAIYRRSLKTGRQSRLLEVLPPLDWQKAGADTWSDVIKQVRKNGAVNVLRGILSTDKHLRINAFEKVLRPVRQPEWWNGDSVYHPPRYQEPVSLLERELQSGRFVVTTEVTPPLGAATGRLINNIEMVKPWVTAVNFTDSSSAVPGMSALACCVTAGRLNAEPVLQIAARDITRASLQAAAIGANSMGIHNVLCVTGDNAIAGRTPTAEMNIVDLDSVQMLWILRRMRDEGIYLDGRRIKDPPGLFLGAATTPSASDPVLQAIRDQKKVNAGARFFQTNLIFEPEKLDPWLEELYKRKVLDKVYIMAGVSPVRTYKLAQYLNTKVPGVRLPEKVLRRLEKAGDNAPEEAVQIALEIIRALKEKQGISGIHLMTLGWAEITGRIVSESGLHGSSSC